MPGRRSKAADRTDKARADAVTELGVHEVGESVLDVPATESKRDVEAAVMEAAISAGAPSQFETTAEGKACGQCDANRQASDSAVDEKLDVKVCGEASGSRAERGGKHLVEQTHYVPQKALVAERMRRAREATILERAEEVVAEERQQRVLLARAETKLGRTSPGAAALPARCAAHWDFALSEMSWLAADVVQERRWKVHMAGVLACEAAVLGGVDGLRKYAAHHGKLLSNAGARRASKPTSEAAAAAATNKVGKGTPAPRLRRKSSRNAKGSDSKHSNGISEEGRSTTSKGDALPKRTTDGPVPLISQYEPAVTASPLFFDAGTDGLSLALSVLSAAALECNVTRAAASAALQEAEAALRTAEQAEVHALAVFNERERLAREQALVRARAEETAILAAQQRAGVEDVKGKKRRKTGAISVGMGEDADAEAVTGSPQPPKRMRTSMQGRPGMELVPDGKKAKRRKQQYAETREEALRTGLPLRSHKTGGKDGRAAGAKRAKVGKVGPHSSHAHVVQPWSSAEDHILAAIVHEFGQMNWGLVSDVLSGRAAMTGLYRLPAHCKQRWKLLAMPQDGSNDPMRSQLAKMQMSKQQARTWLARWLPIDDNLLKAHAERLTFIHNRSFAKRECIARQIAEQPSVTTHESHAHVQQQQFMLESGNEPMELLDRTPCLPTGVTSCRPEVDFSRYAPARALRGMAAQHEDERLAQHRQAALLARPVISTGQRAHGNTVAALMQAATEGRFTLLQRQLLQQLQQKARDGNPQALAASQAIATAMQMHTKNAARLPPDVPFGRMC